MKFMMIFEGVDRASKVMNKIMSSEKKAAAAVKTGAKASERATKAAARATQKQASALSRVGSAARAAYGAMQRGAAAAARAVTNLHRKTVALGKAGVGNIKAGAGKVMRGVGVAGGIAFAVSGSAALAANQLVGTASQFEKFQTVLETTEGSADKARKAMSWVTDFAAKTPYELDQVMESFVSLRAYGLDPTNGLLRDLGDTAAAMNKPLSQAVEAIADAVTGENERLKEFGIKAAVSGNQIAYTYTVNGQKKVVKALKNDPAGIQKTITAIMRERFGGAMDKLSGTWEGMVSNMGDIWTQFQLAIMNAGLFDWMKGKLADALATVNAMKDSGELDKWAANIGQRIQSVLEATWAFAVGLYAVLQKLGGYLSLAAKYVGGWENLGMILAGFAFAPVLVSTAAGIMQIALGITMLGAALMANPILLLIAAIVAGAAAIYMNWGSVKAFFIEVWDSIAAAAEAGWNKLKEWFSFQPGPVLSAAWAGISDAASAALAPVAGIVTGAWELVKTAFSFTPVGIIVDHWSGISGTLSAALAPAFAVVDAVWSKIKSLFDWSPAEAIKAAWAGIADLVGGLIDGVVARASSAWEGVKAIFTFGASSAPSIEVADPATIKATAAATAALKTDLQAVAAIDTGPAMSKLSALEQAAARVKQSVTGSIQQAQAFLSNVSFYNQGVALMDTMAAGIRARASVVTAEIARMAQAVRDHLPSSPAKVGPLSDIHRLKFAETIAGSIRPAPMVKAMRAAAAATMVAASPAMASPTAARAEVARASLGSGGTGGAPVIHFSPTVKIEPGAAGSPDEIEAAVQRALRSGVRELAELLDEEYRRRNRREF